MKFLIKLMFKIVIIAGIACYVLYGGEILAQESATIQAIATVLPSLTVTGDHNLDFGTVFPGTDKSVDKATLGSAGEFHIQGNNNSEITLDFTLPAQLDHATVTTAMVVLFAAIDASYDDESGGGQSSPTGILDPRVQTTIDLGPTGQMDLWIGGTVQPTLTQTGGDYSGDLTLTVTYTGN